MWENAAAASGGGAGCTVRQSGVRTGRRRVHCRFAGVVSTKHEAFPGKAFRKRVSARRARVRAAKMHRDSFWIDSTPDTRFARQHADMFAPVAVIGGGIVGVTTALELQRRGWQTTLVEARRIGRGATGYTTAKVTAGQRLSYSRLQRVAGREVARAYAGAQLEGLQTIIRLVDELDVDCDLERAPNYVFAEADAERELLLVELDAARESGLAMTLEERPDAAFAAVAALRLDGRVSSIRGSTSRHWRRRSWTPVAPCSSGHG